MKELLARRRPLFLLPVLVLVLGLVALGCNGDDGDNGGEGDGTAEATGTAEVELFVDPDAPVVNVDMGEFFFRPEVSVVEAGPVTFNATNVGTIFHELVIVKTDMPVDQLPVVDGKVDEAAAGEEIGEIEGPDAGLTLAGTFELEAGAYALICNVEGHYEGGMFVEFTVQ